MDSARSVTIIMRTSARLSTPPWSCGPKKYRRCSAASASSPAEGATRGAAAARRSLRHVRAPSRAPGLRSGGAEGAGRRRGRWRARRPRDDAALACTLSRRAGCSAVSNVRFGSKADMGINLSFEPRLCAAECHLTSQPKKTSDKQNPPIRPCPSRRRRAFRPLLPRRFLV